jgi:GPH family glycoside/pentoside/hexuronide:cation symporter
MESRDSISRVFAVLIGVIAIFILFWKWVGKRWSKSISYVGGLFIVMICLVGTFWLGKGDMNIMIIITGIIAVGMSSHWVMPWAMIPDVIEYDQVETGERREGMFYAVFGLVNKVAVTLGIIILGWVLEVYKYVPNVDQTEESLLGIRMLFGPIPAVILLIAIPILLYYPINRKSHTEIVASLEKKNI